MRSYLKLFLLLCSFLATNSSAAQDVPPVVQSNVLILRHATPATCQAAQKGSGPNEDVVTDSAVGQTYGTDVSVRSCTGCAVDNQQNCICDKCYYYAN